MAAEEAADAVDTVDEVRVFGRYIVADPRICHGKLTFRGTRIMVATVLEQVADGRPWDEIVREWGGKVTPEGISEAVYLARAALLAWNGEQHKHVDPSGLSATFG
jgi:uncharacterized protein (DUF433 family)